MQEEPWLHADLVQSVLPCMHTGRHEGQGLVVVLRGGTCTCIGSQRMRAIASAGYSRL